MKTAIIYEDYNPWKDFEKMDPYWHLEEYMKRKKEAENEMVM